MLGCLVAAAAAAAFTSPATAVARTLRPSRSCELKLCAPGVLTVDVSRVQGALGIEVDGSNVVATNSGQPGLKVGDVIVAVDGEYLDGRRLGQVIKRKDQYVFTVQRNARAAAASLEAVLASMARSAPVSGKALTTFDDLADGLGAKAFSIVTTLEEAFAAGPPPTEEALYTSEGGLLGFWRLRLTTDAALATNGFTGFGAAPLCLLHASFALIQTAKEPSAQLVEVIGQQNVGQHVIAALKGGWGVQLLSEAPRLALAEAYPRLEFGGSLQLDAPTLELTRLCTYLGNELRIMRGPSPVRTVRTGAGEGGPGGDEPSAKHVYLYERQSAEAAQGDIGRLLDLPVPRPAPTSLDDLDDVPYWARRSSGGGGGGPEPMPMPMPDSMR